eukprot:m.233803 g.233803  ORF g.233803 m.233803 type:complete len:132 (+) comp19303_c0_seq2:270-665(+)
MSARSILPVSQCVVCSCTLQADASDETSIQGKCSCTFGAMGGRKRDVSPCDGKNNSYACVRTLGPTENWIYCEFTDAENFVEYYNLAADPYNLKNLASTASPDQLKTMSQQLKTLRACSGTNCRHTHPTRT